MVMLQQRLACLSACPAVDPAKLLSVRSFTALSNIHRNGVCGRGLGEVGVDGLGWSGWVRLSG